jgi:hypothetical protein
MIHTCFVCLANDHRAAQACQPEVQRLRIQSALGTIIGSASTVKSVRSLPGAGRKTLAPLRMSSPDKLIISAMLRTSVQTQVRPLKVRATEMSKASKPKPQGVA